MKKTIDFLADKDRIINYINKAITSLTLAKNELNKDAIDYGFVFDYVYETQGYLNAINRMMRTIIRNKKMGEEMDKAKG